MKRNGTYLLLAALVAAGLAFSGMSACVCPAQAACCGPACADGAHRGDRPAEESACCGDGHSACALPEAATDTNGADEAPRGLPCSCRTSHRDPVLRKTGSSSDYDGLSVSALRADTTLHPLFDAVTAAPVQAPAARRALHLRLCVWTC